MFHLAFHNLVDLFFVLFCYSWGVSSNIKASLSSFLSNEGNQYKGCKDFNKHTWHCCFCQSLAGMPLGLSSALIVWSGQFCHCIPCIVVLLSIFSICNCSASCFVLLLLLALLLLVYSALVFASSLCFSIGTYLCSLEQYSYSSCWLSSMFSRDGHSIFLSLHCSSKLKSVISSFCFPSLDFRISFNITLMLL